MERVLQIIRERGAGIVQEYLNYKAHTCSQWNADLPGWQEHRRTSIENSWPEYEKFPYLSGRPRHVAGESTPQSLHGTLMHSCQDTA